MKRLRRVAAALMLAAPTFAAPTFAAVMVAATILTTCAGAAAADENPAPAHPELLPVYRQFGEKPGLVALMDELMVNLLADPRTRRFFVDADQAHIKAELVDQFCVILGGPCTYTGRVMYASHKGHSIHASEFNALVEDLQVAMNQQHIPFRAQNRLLAKLAPMYREIVNTP